MLPVAWLVVAVLAAVLLTMWVTFTITRLDRLHARVDAAQASLDAQLVRRAAALLHVAEALDSGLPDALRPQYDAIAQTALAMRDPDPDREDAENAVGRSVAELAQLAEPLPRDAAAELQEAAARVLIARRFYNDAVRDTRSLRAGRLPRLLRMAGRRELPEFFDIDDTLPAPVPVLPSTTAPPAPVPPAPVPTSPELEEDPS